MKELGKPIIIGLSIVLSTALIAMAIKAIVSSKDTISVTGLGETTFTSDLIVWKGYVSVEAYDKQAAYNEIEKSQQKVDKYLKNNGVLDAELTFSNVDASKMTNSRYSDNGNYIGSYFTGWRLSQSFTVTSNDVDKIEQISRQISTRISQGVEVESYNPDYYYTKLDELKLSLIEKASKDAFQRAENIVNNAGAKLGKATSARLGVFQITDPNGSEDYSYGGTFNTSSKEKKASVTVRMEYQLK